MPTPTSRSSFGHCSLADQPTLVMMRDEFTNILYLKPVDESVNPDLDGKRHLRTTTTSSHPHRDRRQQQVAPLVRLCPCSLELTSSPLYCPIEDDVCGTSRAGVLVCWKSSGKRMIGCFAPFIFVWIPIVFLIMAVTFRGRLARSYVRRIVCRERAEEQLQSMLRDHPDRVHNIIQRYERRMARRARRSRTEQEEGQDDSATVEDDDASVDEAKQAMKVTPHLVLKTKTLSARSSGTEEEDEEEQTCSICLGTLQEGTRIGSLVCHHEFHVDCLKTWLKRKNHCPLCNGQGAELRVTENGSTAALDAEP
jgi:Ring finger domain